MKKNKKKVKGFSLVELLAVITILGILTLISVLSIQRIIVKAKEEYYNALERNMIMSTESYITNHNELKPKVEGESIDITLETLKKNKYIDEVIDYYKEKCDEKKSYVRVFNFNKELHYTAYLECPNYNSNTLEKYANIEASITFSGDLKDANAKIVLKDEEYGLASYKYEIMKNNKVVYKSDNILLGQTKSEIIKNIKVTKYTPSTIKIKVTVINAYGISKTISKSTDLFGDKENPKCGSIQGESTDWINGTRTITVECIDNVECEKPSYTKEFKDEAEVGYITIKDTSGRTTDCPVNVYIDKTAPNVTVNIYKRNQNGNKDSTTPVNNISTTSTNKDVTLKVTNDTVNGWLNKSKYPYGVIVEGNYNDKSGIDKIEWQWNDTNLKENDTNVKTYPSTNYSYEIVDQSNGTITKTVSQEGYRYATMTITDHAGNSSKVTVVIPIDRTAPTTPTTAGVLWSNNNTEPTTTAGLTNYNGNWKNKYVYTYPTNSTDALSEIDYYMYKTTGAVGTQENRANRYDVKKEGISNVSYKTCDTAGNCSDYGSALVVKIDTTKPTVTATLSKVDNNNANIGEYQSGEWSTKNILEELVTSDNLSDISKIERSLDKTTWEEITNLSRTYTKEEDAKYYYRVKDGAGNKSSTLTIHIKLDKTGPVYVSKINYYDTSGTHGGAVDRFGWNMYENLSGLNRNNTVFEYCYTNHKNSACGAICSKGNKYSHYPSTLNPDDKRYFQDATKKDGTDGSVGDYELSGGAVDGCVTGYKIIAYFKACDKAGNCTYSGKVEYQK